MAKGSAFERKLCRDLTAWWLGNFEDDVCFWRTAMSGGRATVRRKVGKSTNNAHCGDIGALDERGAMLTQYITFECKRGYNRATIHDLIDALPKAAQQTYAAWIEQAEASSQNAETPHWMIIHARDRREPTVTMPGVLASLLDLLGQPGVETSNGGDSWYFTTSLSVFLGCVDPATIRALARENNAKKRIKK